MSDTRYIVYFTHNFRGSIPYPHLETLSEFKKGFGLDLTENEIWEGGDRLHIMISDISDMTILTDIRLDLSKIKEKYLLLFYKDDYDDKYLLTNDLDKTLIDNVKKYSGFKSIIFFFQSSKV